MYKDNGRQTYNLILYLMDLISVIVSYVLATFLWLGVIKGVAYVAKERIMNEIGLVLFSFLGFFAPKPTIFPMISSYYALLCKYIPFVLLSGTNKSWYILYWNL